MVNVHTDLSSALAEIDAMKKQGDKDYRLRQDAYQEIAELKKQIAYGEKREAVLFASSQDVNYLVDEYRKEIAELKNLITKMRVAAVGDARGPIQGVVEDIETLRFQNDELKKKLEEARAEGYKQGIEDAP
jgi:chromosome segregation ATPase